MRRIALLGLVLIGVGSQATFAMGQTQAVPPTDSTPAAPSTLAPPAVPPKPRGPIRISGGVLQVNRVSFVAPEYPADAKVAKLSGQVVLHVVISKTGSVERAQVVSSTNSIFDQAAMDAVQQWTYRPYRLNGDPIEVDSTVTINFQLRPPTNSESPPGQ